MSREGSFSQERDGRTSLGSAESTKDQESMRDRAEHASPSSGGSSRVPDETPDPTESNQPNRNIAEELQDVEEEVDNTVTFPNLMPLGVNIPASRAPAAPGASVRPKAKPHTEMAPPLGPLNTQYVPPSTTHSLATTMANSGSAQVTMSTATPHTGTGYPYNTPVSSIDPRLSAYDTQANHQSLAALQTYQQQQQAQAAYAAAVAANMQPYDPMAAAALSAAVNSPHPAYSLNQFGQPVPNQGSHYTGLPQSASGAAGTWPTNQGLNSYYTSPPQPNWSEKAKKAFQDAAQKAFPKYSPPILQKIPVSQAQVSQAGPVNPPQQPPPPGAAATAALPKATSADAASQPPGDGAASAIEPLGPQGNPKRNIQFALGPTGPSDQAPKPADSKHRSEQQDQSGNPPVAQQQDPPAPQMQDLHAHRMQNQGEVPPQRRQPTLRENPGTRRLQEIPDARLNLADVQPIIPQPGELRHNDYRNPPPEMPRHTNQPRVQWDPEAYLEPDDDPNDGLDDGYNPSEGEDQDEPEDMYYGQPGNHQRGPADQYARPPNDYAREPHAREQAGRHGRPPGMHDREPPGGFRQPPGRHRGGYANGNDRNRFGGYGGGRQDNYVPHRQRQPPYDPPPPQHRPNRRQGGGDVEPPPREDAGLRDLLVDLQRQVQGLALQNNRARAPIQVPTYTDLSGYPDFRPGNQDDLKKQVTSIPYFGEESVGGVKLKPVDLSNACKSFLAEVVRKGRAHRLSHFRAINELIIENTRGNARFLLQNLIRQPNVTLEKVVRALEVRYLNLVEPDEARVQFFAITREDGEDIHSLKRRLQDRAQMTLRGSDPATKLHEENEMTKSQLIACLPYEVRVLLRERERNRQEMGQEGYSLEELTEAAVQEEAARQAERRKTHQAEDGERKTVTYSFLTPHSRNLSSPPPRKDPPADPPSAGGPAATGNGPNGATQANTSNAEGDATTNGSHNVKIYGTDGQEIPIPPSGNIYLVEGPTGYRPPGDRDKSRAQSDAGSTRSSGSRDRYQNRDPSRDRDRDRDRYRRDYRDRSRSRDNGDRGRSRDRGYNRDRTPGRSADRGGYHVDPEKVGVKPNTCLRCGDPAHDFWTCPTYKGRLPNGPCHRCYTGMHYSKSCTHPAPLPKPDWAQSKV